MFNGKEVRNLRKERNYSLKELAAKSRISISYLSELERGNKRPSLSTIKKLSTALNVSSREFMEQKNSEGITLGERIRMYREENKLSLKELAKASQISYSYLCGIEKGFALPSIRSLRKIAAGLNIPLNNLISTGSDLGTKLTGIRKEHGLNKSQLAKKSGVSPGLIGKLEKGEVQPSLQTIEKIASALEVSPCYFIVEDDGLQELLHLLSPETRSLLLDNKVQSVLRMLRQCNEKEFRFILDFIKMLKQANLCDQE
ncbi:MAG: transcriptional regulator [Firmicutes bacterium]|nr:transcriptional regulator [Bacillota bacterium]